MPRKKKENLVHFDIDTLSKQTEQKDLPHTVSLGETLRSKREKKKLTLEDVSRKLCIKEVYLKALEDGHYYAFPSRVYGIGFLRSYSKFLGLDSDLMVAELPISAAVVSAAIVPEPSAPFFTTYDVMNLSAVIFPVAASLVILTGVPT